jgi:stage III sporulation protein AD
MDTVLKVIFGALIAVILGLMLRQQGKDIALLLSTAVCCMVIAVGISYLTPVVDFVRELQANTGMDPAFIRIILKSVGIGLVAEIAGLICADAGNAALAKTIQILATAVILWLALPLMRALLELVRKMMEEV